MIKRLTTVALAALLVATMSSCILSPKRDKKDDKLPPVVEYYDLSEPWHAVANIEIAYQNRDAAGYRKYVFDAENFTFFFSEADFNAGNTPEQWYYKDETDGAEKLFTSQPDKNGEHPVLSIKLDLYQPDQATWTNVDAPAGFPGETWKKATINYTFEFVTDGDLTYIPQGAPAAEFTVRQIGDEWRVVEWRDLANN